MEAMEPEVFGQYYLVERIATGGMAEVFLARTFRHGGFAGTFVVKRILPELGAQAGFVEMFAEEAKLCVGLQHPNIVRVFDFGRIGPHVYIAMEAVDGRDLHRVLRRAAEAGEAMPPGLAAWVGLQACKALHYAHTRTTEDGELLGLVHRDVSPSNLLLSWEGDVKLADFGIVKSRTLQALGDDAMPGKPEYMAPEQHRGDDVDHRADLWALGVVLWETLTGRRAFRGQTPDEVRERVLAGTLPPVREVATEAPAAVAAVVDRALSADPADRYASARDMGEALRRAVLADSPDERHQEQLASWLALRFGGEAAQERARRQKADVAAKALRDHVVTEAIRAKGAEARRRRAMGVAVVALLALLFGLVGIGVLSTRQPELPEVPVATSGALVVQVSPAAQVKMSGRVVGEGTDVRIEGVSPGEHRLRLEAEGHRAVEVDVRVTRGGTTTVERTLEELPAGPPPVLELRTRPRGATVRLGDRVLGTTPLTSSEIPVGEAFTVAISREGREDATLSVPALVPGDVHEAEVRLELDAEAAAAAASEAPAAPARRAAPAAPTGDGSLQVLLTGATWANVFVDGAKLPKTAPFAGVTLAPGSHEVRVVNAAAGLEHVQTVEVAPGGRVVVRAVIR